MTSAQAEPIVIAHRGASAYLPEHTLAAKAMAHAMNADYIEQDVVLTGDGVPIVLHDIHLEPTTDVEQVFPDRSRPDGHYYAIDFTLAEIRQLHVHERTGPGANGQQVAVFEHRFPVEDALLTVPTLEEEIRFIAGMDRSRGRVTGLYIELKAPNFHLREGQDIARSTLDVLARTGYADRPGQVFLQSFDDKVLRYLQQELRTPLPLIQLIADSAWGEDSAVDYDYLRTDAGLDYVATYAAGIGPWLMQIYLGADERGQPVTDDLIARAHARGLAVHPYTFRRDQLPLGIHSFDSLLDLFLVQLRADGLFTDFPDLARDFIDRMTDRQ
jgi:glycerophosphoryl diester phosphodiesterase